MRSLRQADAGELEWTQDGLMSRQYELRSKDSLFAELRWEGSFSSLATATTDVGAYTFKRTGFLRPRITARLAGTENEVASFHPTWRGDGPLIVEGSREYAWRNAGFWKAAWGFADAKGERIVEFVPKFAIARTVTSLDIAHSALSNSDLPLLVTFGWYMLVMMARESAEAAAVIMS